MVKRLLVPFVLVAMPVSLLALTSSPAQTPEEEEAGELSATARPSSITYRESTAISGRLTKAAKTRDIPVSVQSKPAPFKAPFTVFETVTTKRKGTYRLPNVKPRETTRYQALAPLANARSKTITVKVRPRVTLRHEGDRLRAGELVAFSGTVAPDHDLQIVHIQRRLESRRWRTVGSTQLLDAGTELSEFSRRIRVQSDGIYRARFIHPRDHAPGTSRPQRVNVVER